MLLKRDVLIGIVEGRITLAFRRWKRPTVKSGGTLRTAAGVLAIDAVDQINESKITKADARRAGYHDKPALLAEINQRRAGDLYKIKLRYIGDDPRIELRKQRFSADEFREIQSRLKRMDSSSTCGAWTKVTLNLIAKNPGTRAGDLAESARMETKRFKTNVRKLKELGLTESLKVGYRLSPRGQDVLRRM